MPTHIHSTEAQPRFTATQHDLAEVLLAHAPLPSSVENPEQVKADLFERLSEKLATFVRRGEPVPFYGPSFAFKSPAVGLRSIEEKADAAEKDALIYIAELAKDVQHIYPQGGIFNWFQDGHMFVPFMLGYGEEKTDEYLYDIRRIRNMVSGDQVGNIKLHTSRDFLDAPDLHQMREKFIRTYGQPDLGKVKQKVCDDPRLKADFLGLKKFYEDIYKYLREIGELDITTTTLQNKAKATAYQMIQTREAWENLARHQVPDGSIRLSFTLDSVPTEDKLGVYMGTSRIPDRWLTPWHGLLVKDDAEDTNGRCAKEKIFSKFVYTNAVGFVPKKDEDELNYMGFPDSVLDDPVKQEEMLEKIKLLSPKVKMDEVLADYQRPDTEPREPRTIAMA